MSLRNNYQHQKGVCRIEKSFGNFIHFRSEGVCYHVFVSQCEAQYIMQAFKTVFKIGISATFCNLFSTNQNCDEHFPTPLLLKKVENLNFANTFRAVQRVCKIRVASCLFAAKYGSAKLIIISYIHESS